MTRLFHMVVAFLISPSLWAMAPSGEKPNGQGLGMFLPLMLTFFVFYFLILRPQQRRERAHQENLKAIEKGDEIVTKGGLMGKVTNVADKVVTLEVADKVRVRIDRDFVASIEKQKA